MPGQDSFEVTTEDVGDARVLGVRGEADRFRTEEVSGAIDAARREGRKAVVDLSAVTYLDSSMLAALVAASEQGRRRAEPLVIVCETPRLRRSLQLKGLETILQIVESREQALELLAGSGEDVPPVPEGA
jgi:anti-sigma B factor antagonist